MRSFERDVLLSIVPRVLSASVLFRRPVAADRPRAYSLLLPGFCLRKAELSKVKDLPLATKQRDYRVDKASSNRYISWGC